MRSNEGRLELGNFYPKRRQLDMDPMQVAFRKKHNCCANSPCVLVQCTACGVAAELGFDCAKEILRIRNGSHLRVRIDLEYRKTVETRKTTLAFLKRFKRKAVSVVQAAGPDEHEWVGRIEFNPRCFQGTGGLIVDPENWTPCARFFTQARSLDQFIGLAQRVDARNDRGKADFVVMSRKISFW